MASIDKLPSGRWKARWRTPDRKQRAKVFLRKVDAERFLTSVEHEKLSGSYVDPRAGRVSFQEFAEQWRLAQIHRPTTREQVEAMLRNHAYPAFGDRALSSIRPSELQTWVRSLEDQLAPSTVEVVGRHVVSVFRAAVKDRLIATSPADGLSFPKPVKQLVAPLTVDQVMSISEAIQPRYEALVLLMAATGVRPAEAFGLVADVYDFDAHRIVVEQQLVTIGGQPTFGPPKTEASNRTIPVPEFLSEKIRAHVESFGLGDQDVLFSDAQGRLIRRNRFGEVWRQTMKGLEFDCVGPHQLRHHYASLLIAHGESVKVVQARLGHSSASETLDTYAHLWPDSEDSTRAAVTEAYNGSSI